MRDRRKQLASMTALGMNGGLSPKASKERRKNFGESIKELASIRSQIEEIKSNDLSTYQRGAHRVAVISRLRTLKGAEQKLHESIEKEKRSSEYQPRHFDFTLAEAEVNNITSTLSAHS